MYQGPVNVASTQDVSAKLGELRAKANELKLHASDLEVRKSQLGDQRRRLAADVDHSAIDKQLATVEHELASTRIQLETMDQQITDLQTERDMARAFNLQHPPGPPGPPFAITEVPGPFPVFVGSEQIFTIGGVVLLLPFAIVLARRLWVRGAHREVVDLENSPRLQRIEQAVESIAVEVERIGEAQRFTTKLLAERQPDVAARIPAITRREPGTITPH
jgi:hypothetical protein